MPSTYFLVLAALLVVGFGTISVLLLRIDSLRINRSDGCNIASSNSRLSENPDDNQLIMVEPGMQVRFGSPANPAIKIALAKSLPASSKPLKIPEAAKARVTDWLCDVGRLYGIGSGLRTLEVTFSPEVTRELASGQLELMRSAMGHRPFAFDPASGRAREIAILANGVNPVAAATFAWQVLAIATAQKYMSDINKRLANIGHDIGVVREFLFDNHESELAASFDYLQQVASTVADGKLSPEDVLIIGGQLEDIERQCARVMEHSYRACQRTIDATRSDHPRAWRDLESFVKYAQTQASEFQLHGRISLLALGVRSAATYLRVALPLNKMIAQHRSRHLREDLKDFDNFRRNFSTKLIMACESIDAVFRTAETIEAAKQTAKAKADDAAGILGEHQDGVTRALEAIEGRLRDFDEPNALPTRWFATIGDSNEVKLTAVDDSKTMAATTG